MERQWSSWLISNSWGWLSQCIGPQRWTAVQKQLLKNNNSTYVPLGQFSTHTPSAVNTLLQVLQSLAVGPVQPPRHSGLQCLFSSCWICTVNTPSQLTDLQILILLSLPLTQPITYTPTLYRHIQKKHTHIQVHRPICIVFFYIDTAILQIVGYCTKTSM